MLTPIGDLFLKTVKKYQLGSVAEAALVCSTFMKITEHIFSNVSKGPKTLIKESTYAKGVLSVTVIHSAIAQELFLRTEEILHRITNELPHIPVKKIKIRIG